MTKSKWQIRSDYFDNIDNEEKAYFLGFLYADGYNNERRGEVKIRLHAKDEALLLRFRDILYPEQDRPLRSYVYPKGRIYKELIIGCRKISQVLAQWGCIQAKSFEVKFPFFLDKSLYRHFIRGVFDGDGCISLSTLKSGKHKTYMSITGYRSFLDSINKILSVECLLNENKLISSKNKDPRIVSLMFSGCRQCLKIRDYLYKGATIYLPRKYEKFNLLGTSEWRTYDNMKVNLYDRTIKIGDYFNPKFYNQTGSTFCRNCNLKLTYQHKIYDINKHLYCSKCYSKLFRQSVTKHVNKITLLETYGILHIKEEQIFFDLEDVDKINRYKWHIEGGRVVSRTIKPKKCIYLNRLIKEAEEGQSVAFKDGNHFNMRKENLEKRDHR